MRAVLLVLLCMLQGCLILLEDDCDLYHPEYSHTEYDCYYGQDRVQVCKRYYCWEETREVEICDEHHVCYDNRRWR